MDFRQIPLKAAVLVWAFGLAEAQTSIDLRSQARNVDFSAAASTKPSKTGTALPASCAVGETFFKTNAAAGRNLYFCTQANIWSQMSGNSGTLPASAIPIIDSSGSEADSGCTATLGTLNCPNGFSSGTGASQITMKEGAAPSVAPGGQQTLFVDSVDHRLKFIDSAGTVRAFAADTSGGPATGAITTYDSSGGITASGCSITAGVLSCGMAPGTTFTIPSWYEFPAGVCQGGNAFLGFNAPVANAPAPACVNGSNTMLGIAAFTAAQSGQLRFVLPDDWVAGTGNDLEFRFRSESAGGAGNVVWSVQTACSAISGGTVDPSFNAPQTASAGAQGNNLSNKATVSGLTTTGCSAGNMLFLKFALDGTTTSSGLEDLLSLRFKLRRAISTL